MRRYWLMKSEPGCFSFQDLLDSPGQTTSWDGVRNYQARNLLRDQIKMGDGVLFYHSNIKDPAIVGTAVVVKEGYPDHTARDPRNDHFDPRSSEENPIWFMVDVKAASPLEHVITRTFMKEHPRLCGLDVLKKGNRLSVQEVSLEHWQEILTLAGLKE